jgi:hypothetical protein
MRSLRSGFDQPEGHLRMEGAKTLAVPGSPGAPRPGAVERAGVATDRSHVLGAGPAQGGRAAVRALLVWPTGDAKPPWRTFPGHPCEINAPTCARSGCTDDLVCKRVPRRDDLQPLRAEYALVTCSIAHPLLAEKRCRSYPVARCRLDASPGSTGWRSQPVTSPLHVRFASPPHWRRRG